MSRNFSHSCRRTCPRKERARASARASKGWQRDLGERGRGPGHLFIVIKRPARMRVGVRVRSQICSDKGGAVRSTAWLRTGQSIPVPSSYANIACAEQILVRKHILVRVREHLLARQAPPYRDHGHLASVHTDACGSGAAPVAQAPTPRARLRQVRLSLGGHRRSVDFGDYD